jgi:hypothetical protein
MLVITRFEHLIEGHAVDGDCGVVLGDDLLARDVDHLLHHGKLAPDAVDVRDNEAEARRQRFVIAAETLDCVIVALRHLPDAHPDGHDREQGYDDRQDLDRQNFDALEHRKPPLSAAASGARRL